MTLNASLIARLGFTLASGDAHGGSASKEIEKLLTFEEGTGANQADLPYIAERQVADGGNDDIDLAGVLTDIFGETITNAEIAALFVLNQRKSSGTANTTDLTIGGGSNPFLGFLGGTTPTIGPLKPGAGCFLFAGDAAGLGAVTASTADILRISNSAGAVNNYQIGIIGRSA